MALLTGHQFTFDYLLPRFMKEMKDKTDCVMPKYTHFSTHQEFLGPFMTLLGEEKYNFRRVEPASSLFLEIYERCKAKEKNKENCKKRKYLKMVFMKDSETVDSSKEIKL